MGMRATLIEVDGLVPERLWYAPLAGRRLWCQAAREMVRDDGWLVMPGQGVGGDDPYSAVIFAEHAWEIRQGEVELMLVEIEPTARPGDLALAAGDWTPRGRATHETPAAG